MRLASTTLTGNNQEIIGDALRSAVKWVDLCIVIDTGATDSDHEVQATRTLLPSRKTRA